jgi:uncharacterized protein
MKPLPHDPSPWWRHRMMWLVVGGPLLVVVAAIATAVIATRGADPALKVRESRQNRASAPAVQARNHAATPAAAEATTKP